MPALRRTVCLLMVVAVLPLVCAYGAADGQQAPSDLNAFARKVRDAIAQDYAQPNRLTYLEQRRDVDISRLGKVSIGPLRTFEVYPNGPNDTWKRLIAIDGKPLDPEELKRRDAEHAKHEAERAARERSETPRQRASRLKKDAEEIRERDAILDDALSVFELVYICHETFDGHPVIVVSLKPRQNAPVTTREGGWMKQMEGRMWVSQADHRIARLRVRATDHVSIGWGVVARVEPGSGFDYVRRRVGDIWAPAELTIEGSGRTLLFRRFQVKTVTTYTRHQLYSPPGS